MVKMYVGSLLMAGVLYLIYHTGATKVSLICMGLTLLYFITSVFGLRTLQFLTVVGFVVFIYYTYTQVLWIIQTFSFESYLELFYLVFLPVAGWRLYSEVV